MTQLFDLVVEHLPPVDSPEFQKAIDSDNPSNHLISHTLVTDRTERECMEEYIRATIYGFMNGTQEVLGLDIVSFELKETAKTI
jgi:hypothetical protein